MPLFAIFVKAEMEGVQSFTIPPTCCWTLDVKQAAGDEERNGVVIDPEDLQEVPNTKNSMAHFQLKFEGAKNFSTLKVLTEEEIKADKKLKCQPRPQTAEDTEMVPMLIVECRGMEPVRWHPTGDYCAEALSGTLYEEVNFRDGEDWCEYDEKSGESMTITKDIKYEIRRV